MLKRKIRKYAELVEEQKIKNRERAESPDNLTFKAASSVELREDNVTKKMGRTDIGDISNAIDPFEMGSRIA